jgi:hypothetical protein
MALITIRNITANGNPVFPGENITFPNIGSAGTSINTGADVVLFVRSCNAGAETVTMISDTGALSYPTSGNIPYIFIDPQVVGNTFGVYNTGLSSGVQTIFVTQPSVQLSLIGVCPNGCKVPLQGARLDMDIASNIVISSPQLSAIGGSKVSLIFTTPSGGKTTVFGTADNTISPVIPLSFANIPMVTGDVTKSVFPTFEQTGVWYVNPRIEIPSIGCFDIDEEIGFNVTQLAHVGGDPYVTVEDIVGRKPFLTTITGNPCTNYAITMEREDGETDFVPVLHPGLVGNQGVIQGTTTPVFITDVHGSISMQYDVDPASPIVVYNICVFNVTKGGSATAPVYTLTSNNPVTCVQASLLPGDMTIAVVNDIVDVRMGEVVHLAGTNSDTHETYLFIDATNFGEGKSLPDMNNGNMIDAKDNMTPISVGSDDAWTFDWDTAACELDSDVVKIYATSVLTNGNRSTATTNTASGKVAVGIQASAHARLDLNFITDIPEDLLNSGSRTPIKIRRHPKLLN